MKKAAFYTLGCKVNQYESEALKDLFRQEGYRVVPFAEKADVYVINSCTVTHLSDGKSRQAVRRAARQNPEAVVAVIGCYPQVAPEEAAEIPGVDILLGTGNRRELPALVEKARRGHKLNLVREKGAGEAFEDLPWPGEAGRTRAFLKIQEGCQEYCTYCIIPHARGSLRSQEPGEVLNRVAAIRDKGYGELVLTGTHLGAWGRDLVPPRTLSSLLYQIQEEGAPGRVRLSSLEPVDVDEGLLRALKDIPRICRHLHIPLQSGSDEILQAMARPYRQEDFRRLAAGLRDLDPRMALSTDIIVGFPGEEDRHFQETLSFVREMAFSRLHVFKFSPRRGTEAAGLPGRVPPRVMGERAEILRALGKELAQEYAEKFLHTTLDVLLEKPLPGGNMEGLTEHYLRARLKGDSALKSRMVPVFITGAREGLLYGELRKQPGLPPVTSRE